jgi:uncharacterized C2H2 Zn-finger protein
MVFGKTGNFIAEQRYQCKLCPIAVTSESILKEHIKVVHDKIRDYECDVCHAKFGQKHNMIEHKRNVHEKIKDFKCKECGAMFGRVRGLREHIMLMHDKLKRFECGICGDRFGKSQYLKDHTKIIHDKIKDQKCEECGMLFHTKSNLTNHVNSVHRKIRHECDQCEASFSQRCSLSEHKKKKHKIEPKKCGFAVTKNQREPSALRPIKTKNVSKQVKITSFYKKIKNEPSSCEAVESVEKVDEKPGKRKLITNYFEKSSPTVPFKFRRPFVPLITTNNNGEIKIEIKQETIQHNPSEKQLGDELELKTEFDGVETVSNITVKNEYIE